MIALLVLLPAFADGACPLTTDEVRDAAVRSETAIGADEPGTHRAVFAEIVSQAHCLDALAPPEAWARLLANEAMVRVADGEPAGAFVAAARRADPTLTLPSFLANEGGEVAQPLPGALATDVWVDGVPVGGPVHLLGLHIVQWRAAGELSSVVLLDEDLPAQLMEAPPAPPPEPPPPPERTGSWWLGAALGGGWWDRDQRVDRPGELLHGSLDRGPVVTGSAWGRVALAGPLGIVADAGLVGPVADPCPEGVAGLALGAPAVAAWLGGGLVGVPVDEIDGRRLAWLPQPVLGVAVSGTATHPFDLWLGGGFTPGVWNVRARWGTPLVDLGGAVALRLGTDVSGVGAAFDQAPPGLRSVAVTRWSGALTLGVSAARR